MTPKKWLMAFFATCLLLAGAVAAVNVAVDPFGVFGDRLLYWYSYNETLNPRVAKTAYLEQHHEAYDSYFVGCSSTSSFPAAAAEQYFGGKFYNTIMYGADMLDCEQTVSYLIDHYTVKTIVLNVHLLNGESYDVESDPYTYRMHEKMSGENPLLFYGRYAFANLNYAFGKLRDRQKDTYFNQTFDVFDEQTGEYDKRLRDSAYIGDLDEYLAAYPEFVNYPHRGHGLTQTENTMASVARIRDKCAQAGVHLIVLSAPIYGDALPDYDEAQVQEFYRALAAVTPYWDFSVSSVSFEPRYFYDEGHLRNAVGAMALARIAGDDSVYIPADFGVYVTADTVDAHVATLFDAAPQDTQSYTADVPILMYHHLTGEIADDMNISPALFAQHLDALAAAGYTTVSLAQLRDYVERGAALPEKPIVITFDDGYRSNYEFAYPALATRGMKGTIFAIGVSVGKDAYKDTDFAITPHFSWDEAREMVASGVMEVQSHTFDLHQWQDYETAQPARQTAMPLPDESETDYIAALRADSAAWKQAAADGGLETPFAFAYPQGEANTIAEAVLLEEGYGVTLRTERGINTLVRGLPQSLRGLKRIGVSGAWSAEELLAQIETYR